MMLIVECNSLYFWSLASSNLESVVTGHKKFLYLQNFKKNITSDESQYVRIVPVMKYRNGILLQPLKIGSVVFQVPLINLEEFAGYTRSIITENLDKKMVELATEIPNFHFLHSLFKSIGIAGNQNKHHHDDDDDDDDDVQFFKNINENTNFSIGLVGDKKVITLVSSDRQITRDNIFDFSSLVTSSTLAVHALFSIAFSGYKDVKPIKFSTSLEQRLKANDSALFYLLQYLFGCSIDVHDFIFG